MSESPLHLLSLPDDLIAQLTWWILQREVASACNFCAVSRPLHRFAPAVKQWASEMCAKWLHEYSNGHLILGQTLAGLPYHCSYHVFAAGNMLPTKGVTAWNLYVQLSCFNSGFMDLGVCDEECKVAALTVPFHLSFSPVLFTSPSFNVHAWPQMAWGLNLHTGKLRHASLITFNEPSSRGQHDLDLERQLIPSALTRELFPQASSFTLQIVVDHDRGNLFFGTKHREGFQYWDGMSFSPHKQLRPHASLFFCNYDHVTISKYFFAVDFAELSSSLAASHVW